MQNIVVEEAEDRDALLVEVERALHVSHVNVRLLVHTAVDFDGQALFGTVEVKVSVQPVPGVDLTCPMGVGRLPSAT